ncbi:DUF6112 family protein [Nocardioides hankookensis]|uniref:DUF6112 family protein n=1 Tax=Nocardioides hankookensis TaxID=443157 RepID=A0ABW1LMY9_9ACTN
MISQTLTQTALQGQYVASQVTAFVVRAGDPGISPNNNGLPGVQLAKKMAGGLLVFGFIGCFVALVLAAIVWAVGANSSNSHAAERGKKGVLVSLVASLLIGGANVLVGTFSGMGAEL